MSSRYLQPTGPTHKIAQEIISFFIEEQEGNIDKANDEMAKIKIVYMEFVPGQNGKKGILTIFTSRPGRLIGHHGKRIGALTEYLKKFHVGTVKITEAFDWGELMNVNVNLDY